MKKLLTAALISTAMAAFPAFAHHAAEGWVGHKRNQSIGLLAANIDATCHRTPSEPIPKKCRVAEA